MHASISREWLKMEFDAREALPRRILVVETTLEMDPSIDDFNASELDDLINDIYRRISMRGTSKVTRVELVPTSR